jgi:tyrosine/nicotianamine family aminotransferase
MKIAQRVNRINYAIRDLDTNAKGLIKLNIGDPAFFGFKTPEPLVNAMSESVKNQKGYYTDSQGLLELREVIARMASNKGISADANNVIITTGASEAVNLIFACLMEKGSEVLLPAPTYPQYSSVVNFFEGNNVFYKCDEENNWQPDVDDIRRKISEKTAAIVVINPNNPTGAVYKPKVLRQIIDIAAEHNLPIISDEIYDDMVIDGTFTPTASLTKEVPIITLNGISKNYLAPGWRLGWMILSNLNEEHAQLKEALLKLCRLRLCASTPAQFAAAKALDNTSHIAEVRNSLRKRRDFVLKRFSEIKTNNVSFSCTKPEAAFYAFPKLNDKHNLWKSDLDFVKDLRDNGKVLVVHGSGFNYEDLDSKTKHFRLVFLPELDVLEEAFNRIEKFVKSKSVG